MSTAANPARPARMTWRWALGILPLVYLCWLLVNQLGVPWSTNPQYAYGWAVPFLCGYLIWQRLQESEGRGRRAESAISKSNSGIESPKVWLLVSGFWFLAFLYA